MRLASAASGNDESRLIEHVRRLESIPYPHPQTQVGTEGRNRWRAVQIRTTVSLRSLRKCRRQIPSGGVSLVVAGDENFLRAESKVGRPRKRRVELANHRCGTRRPDRQRPIRRRCCREAAGNVERSRGHCGATERARLQLMAGRCVPDGRPTCRCSREKPAAARIEGKRCNGASVCLDYGTTPQRQSAP
jgi:hypothetical protein